jgi:hypothetical protein
MSHMRSGLVPVILAALVAACSTEKVDLDEKQIEVVRSPLVVGGFEAADILFVVDNSGSMGQEQAILATGVFTMLNSLTDPLPGWPYPAADDVRVAVVSSDMGLQWGDPSQPPPDGVQVSGCNELGDNGSFLRGAYETSGAISIQNNAIPCSTDTQCPTGFTCDGKDDSGIGACHRDGSASPVACPALDADHATTSPDAKDPLLAFETACLTMLGTDGCGFEQQLRATTSGLAQNPDFLREDALLAIVVVSDEEDCSLATKGVFDSPEFNDSARMNTACGEHPEALFTAGDMKDKIVQAKDGKQGAVVFSAIVGVPYDPKEPGADGVCQGSGNAITGCLDAEDMQPVLVDEITISGGPVKEYRPACTRGPADAPVTKARPGRRFVELAQEFGGQGYVYSICNADWSPVMKDTARLVAESVSGKCYDEKLPWDEESRTSTCDVVVEVVDADACPFEIPEGTQVATDAYSDDTGDHTSLFCPLPKLAAPLDCADAGDAVSKDDFGWYYCESAEKEPHGGCDIGVTVTEKAKHSLLGERMWVQCPAAK